MANSSVVRIPALSERERRRFFSYVRKGKGRDDCWVWTGGTFNSGYGFFSLHGKVRSAHRISYRIHVGNTTKHLDHLCHDPASCPGGVTCPHRRCVNPAHLAPASTRENVLRGGGKSAQNARKTRCSQGHEFTAANTAYGPKGERRCKQCAREKTARYREQNRDEVLARRREQRERVVHDPMTCPACGESFVPQRATATVCPACREPGSERRRTYMREYMRARRGSSG